MDPRQVISTARTCNLILIVLDAMKPLTHKRLIEHELEGFGIRLNKEPPNITVKKKVRCNRPYQTRVTAIVLSKRDACRTFCFVSFF